MEARYLPIGIQDFEDLRRRGFDEVAEDALIQIDANGYVERFAVSGKKMFKVGVVFSSDSKGIVGWKY